MEGPAERERERKLILEKKKKEEGSFRGEERPRQNGQQLRLFNAPQKQQPFTFDFFRIQEGRIITTTVTLLNQGRSIKSQSLKLLVGMYFEHYNSPRKLMGSIYMNVLEFEIAAFPFADVRDNNNKLARDEVEGSTSREG
jgi:hypothetical protein